jgi:hypothetical protein
MSSVNDEIRTRVNAFVDELSALVRQATVGEIVDALKNADRHSPARRASASIASPSAREDRNVAVRKPGRPAKAPIAVSKAGQYRGPELVAQIMQLVQSHLKGSPGQAIASIAASLRTSKQDLQLPIRKLMTEKKITSTGTKRGTRYFPK